MGLNIICYKGCALAVASGPWHLTFALGQLGYLSFLIEILCWEILDYTGSENRAPFNFSSNTALQSFTKCPNPCQKRIKVILGDKSFQVAAPRLWNVLPSEVRALLAWLMIFSRKHLLVTPSTSVSMITCVL